MREWKLKPGDPICLTLAADARLCAVDYADDQIWELNIGGESQRRWPSKPATGCAPEFMRIFPRFTQAGQARVDPLAFASPPRLVQFYPNYLRIDYAPFLGLDVIQEVWAAESHAVCGHIHLANNSVVPQEVRMEWVAWLGPLGDGRGMEPVEIEGASTLQGCSGDLRPVFFLSGGALAGSGSFPSLYLDLELLPGNSKGLTWTQAALKDVQQSLDLARLVAGRPWEAELARIEMQNASQEVEIHTGDPDWDAALAMSQRAALRLFVGAGAQLPSLSYVSARQPDQGASLRGDGSDYGPLWNGQTALECTYLASLILPGAPHLAQGLLRNFLAVQEESGFIDWKPGLAGQRGRLMSQPLLATLAWRIYQVCEERAFLEEIYPPLAKYLEAWFAPQHDSRSGTACPSGTTPCKPASTTTPLSTAGDPGRKASTSNVWKARR